MIKPHELPLHPQLREHGLGSCQSRCQQPEPVRGFTLIEVLVVVAIIALLMAILLPSLQRAREQARVVVCGSNLRTSGTAIHYYTQANGEFYPPSGAWAEYACPYVQKGGVTKFTGAETTENGGLDIKAEFYSCPSDPIRAPTGQVRRKIGGQIRTLNYLVSYVINVQLVWPLRDVAAAQTKQDYALIPAERMNAGFDPLGNPIWVNMQKASAVKRSSEIVLLADGGDDEVSAASAYWDFDDGWDSSGPVLEVHHRTGNNFMFADLHVEYKKVLGEGTPRRGVPSVPWHWVPINGLQATPGGEP